MLMILVALMPLPVLIWSMMHCHRTGKGWWFVGATVFPTSILSLAIMSGFAGAVIRANF